MIPNKHFIKTSQYRFIELFGILANVLFRVLHYAAAASERALRTHDSHQVQLIHLEDHSMPDHRGFDTHYRHSDQELS